jgi:hypothetical protein
MSPDLPILELLVPWELPTEQPLNPSDQLRVGQALRQFLRALESSHEAAIQLVDQALAELGPVATSPAQPSSTKTPLKQLEVEDFDVYFAAVHVQSADPVGCLVQSLLVTYRRLLSLWLQDERFDPVQIAQQKQGFVSYVYLLGRVFHLTLDPHDSNQSTST